MTKREQKVKELMDKGFTESQAYYATDFTRRSKDAEYKPRPRKDWTSDEFKSLGIVVRPATSHENYGYSWIVEQNGRQRTIFTTKGTVYKDGSCKYYPALTINNNGKQRTISLGAAIWLGFIGKDIPSGYVVDHIDNDSFNNDVSNLQLLTIRENIIKNPSEKLANKNK